MTPEELTRALRETWDDQRLSRGERKSIVAHVAEGGDAARVRASAFGLARDLVADDARVAEDVLTWLHEIVKATVAGDKPRATPPSGGAAQAWFAPHENVLAAITGAFDAARVSADVCVFTITDDRITRAIIDAHRRGVKLRVVSDDDKSGDLGSDIERLASAGVVVRVDRTEAHMHHKFAIFDGQMLLNGSYNWTRSAGIENHENVVALRDPTLLAAFATEFERVWGLATPFRG